MSYLFTVREVASMVNLHEFTIRRHIRSGKLAAVKVGGRLRIRPEDVERYMVPLQTYEEPEPVAPVSARERRVAAERILRRRDRIGTIDISVTDLIDAGLEGRQ